MSSDNYSHKARGKRWWIKNCYVVERRRKGKIWSWPCKDIEEAEQCLKLFRQDNPEYDYRLTEVRYGPWEPEKEE